MLIRYGYELEFFCNQPTLMLSMLDTHVEHQPQIRWQTPFISTPFVPSDTYRDSHGNEVRRFMAPAGRLKIFRDHVLECDGSTDLIASEAQEVPVEQIPSRYLVYLAGSRYCETDKLSQVAWDLFGHVAPGWARVKSIFDFVHQHLAFDYAHARSDRTAYEAYQDRVGVCRDFAHLALAFCRCMNIPARYGNGFMGDIGVPPDPAPMDYNAWVEVYLDHCWYVLDARHNIPRIGRITVSRGRDAADIPLVHSFGAHTLTSFKVWTDEVYDEVLQDLDRQSA